MKTKTLILLAVVALAATAPAKAAAPVNQTPQVIIIVDYDGGSQGRPHIFRSVCEYLRYFAPRFWPCWP